MITPPPDQDPPPGDPGTPEASRAPWRLGPGTRDVVTFLSGPRSRLSEARRVGRIAVEFIRGFRKLHFLGPAVTVFGSARFGEHHPAYRLARTMGRQLAEAGLVTITGGGPGVMEAANRGAREAGGHSVGCNIRLPREQEPNPYLDQFVEFDYFFVRKVMLVKYSSAFLVLPGGFGTMDELFESLTLVQTRKIDTFPIVLMGTAYWRPLCEFMRETLARVGTIDPDDLSLLTITDDPDVAMAAVHRGLVANGVQARRPSRILREG